MRMNNFYSPLTHQTRESQCAAYTQSISHRQFDYVFRSHGRKCGAQRRAGRDGPEHFMAASGKVVRQIGEMSLAATNLSRRTYLQDTHRMIEFQQGQYHPRQRMG